VHPSGYISGKNEIVITTNPGSAPDFNLPARYQWILCKFGVVFATITILKGMKRATVIMFLAVVLALASCTPVEKLPPEPMIEFRSFTLFDTVDILGNFSRAGRLAFYFEDGDGDVGLDDPTDPLFEPSSNLFMQLYRKNGDIFELAEPSDPLYPSEYRIPYLEAGGQNKILKGTIEVTMIYFLYNERDTVYYDFWISDRGGNLSNTATTCVIDLGETGSTCGED
jgi:hypothetical protein